MSTTDRMSQPAAMAPREAMPVKMPWLTPMTANVIAIEPKTDIWKRCIAIESLARV